MAGRRVLVAMVRQAARETIQIACYQADSQRLLWRHGLGELPPARPVQPGLPTCNPEPPVVLTLHGSVVYCNTNRGMVAALRVRDGRLQWLRTYPREVASQEADGPDRSAAAAGRSPPACLFHQGLLLLAPADSRELLALDAASGLQVWSCRMPWPVLKLVGMLGDQLILMGNRLWAIDIATGTRVDGWGEQTAGWGESVGDPEDGTGAGEGVIAGKTLYWPWDGKVWVLNRTTGRPSVLAMESVAEEPMVDLPNAARLSVAGGRLIAAGSHRITVYQVATAGSNGAGSDGPPENDHALPR